MSGARCVGKWWLFDSTNPSDHLEARELCAGCPMRLECSQTVATTQGAEGTWAGRLYGATARARRKYEDTQFTDEEARAAHAAWTRAKPSQRTRFGVGDRVVTGERVYQRRASRRRTAGRAA